MAINFQIKNNPDTSPATRADVQKYFSNLEAGLNGDALPVTQTNTTYTLNNLTNAVSGDYLQFEFINANGDFAYSGTAPIAGSVTTLNVYSGTKVGDTIVGLTLWATISPVNWDANALFVAVVNGDAAAFDQIFYGQDNFVYSGGTGKDTFTGSFFGDNIDGGAGNDTLFGDKGDDTFIGGDGIDTMDGGADIDTIDYSSIANTAHAVVITLGAANANAKNTSVAGSIAAGDIIKNVENITSGFGNDKLTGNSGANILNGGFGDDVLTGGDGDDTLTGDTGADVFIGGLGADIMIGGENSSQEGIAGDKVDYSASNAGVSIQLARNNFGTASGGHAQGDQLAGILGLVGSKYNDVLRGDVSKDTFNVTLSGGGGDDIIQAAKNDFGTNMLDGGENGAVGDTLDYAFASTALTIALSNTKDVLVVVGNAPGNGTQIKNFENIIGGSGNDTLTGNNVVNVIEGGAGADELVGGLGIDTLSYASSANGVTVWLFDKQGLSNPDGSKNGGETAQSGGTGDSVGDTLWGFENIIGSANDDFIVGNDSVNVLKGGAGSDSLTGVKGDDVLYGEAGDDTFEAGDVEMGAGKDTMDGGADVDLVNYDGVTDGITITLGKDGALATVKSKVGNAANGDKLISIEAITTDNGNDVLTGNNVGVIFDTGNGNDTLIGSTLNDVINGGDDDDLFYMTLGEDLLNGAGDFDTLNASKMTVGVDVNLATSTYKDIATGGAAFKGQAIQFDSVVGTAKDDIIRGRPTLRTTVDGGAGNDIIEGGSFFNLAGGDTLIGGTGIDTLSYEHSTAGVSITLKAGKVAEAGTGGDDEGDVATGFENLIGSASIDTLIGDTGNNVIEGGKGADTLTGGGGTDTLSYAGSVNGVTLNLNGPTDQAIIFVTGSDADGDKATGFINLTGSGADDALRGDSRGNVINGGAGKDAIVGGDGADTLFGGAGEDAFEGDLGADKIDGGTSGSERDEVSYIAVTDNITLTLGANGAAAKVSSKAGNEAAGDTLTNIERVYAGGGNDALTGNNLDHDLRGDNGNDTLVGGTGSSFLYGEGGDDIIFASVSNGGKGGDVGTETYSGGDDYDTLNFSKLTSGVSIDLSGNSAHYIPGTKDVFIFEFENVIGTAKDDNLRGTALGTKVDGGDGNDIIEGGQTADTLIGGKGIDTLSYAHSAIAGVLITLKAGQAADVGPGSGDSNGDVATGFENLLGSSKTDTLTGDTGSNFIEGGGEDDLLIGGLGNDTVSYASSALGVVVNLNKQGATLADGVTIDVSKLASAQGGSGDAAGDLLYNFENIVGSADNDTLIGDDNKNIIDGGDGGDNLFGNGGDDTLRGGSGADIFSGGAGKDTMDGGADQDSVSYEGEADAIVLTLGKGGASATVSSKAGSAAAGDKIISIETVTGGSGADKLTGNDLLHTLRGDKGDDTLTGGTGNSNLFGDGGNDTIIASVGDLEVYDGGADTDTLSFASFGAKTSVTVNLSSSIYSATGIDVLTVSNFEIVIGGAGNDELWGNNATGTKLQGGAGADMLVGVSAAVDTLTGGAGNDTFLFLDELRGKDVITDFTNGDKLQINSSSFGGGLPLSGALPDATWLVVGTGDVATGAGHGQFIYNTVSDTLFWDEDGVAGGQIAIGQFGSSVVLKLADFTLA